MIRMVKLICLLLIYEVGPGENIFKDGNGMVQDLLKLMNSFHQWT